MPNSWMTLGCRVLPSSISFFSDKAQAEELHSTAAVRIRKVSARWTRAMGCPYSVQVPDLFYHNWSDQRKAWFDAFTVLFLIFYLAILLYGGLGSTAYSLGYWGDSPLAYFSGLITGSEEIGRIERSSTAWRPFIWPVKTIMVVGFFLMLLQALSELFKDVARIKGHEISPHQRAAGQS